MRAAGHRLARLLIDSLARSHASERDLRGLRLLNSLNLFLWSLAITEGRLR